MQIFASRWALIAVSVLGGLMGGFISLGIWFGGVFSEVAAVWIQAVGTVAAVAAAAFIPMRVHALERFERLESNRLERRLEERHALDKCESAWRSVEDFRARFLQRADEIEELKGVPHATIAAKLRSRRLATLGAPTSLAIFAENSAGIPLDIATQIQSLLFQIGEYERKVGIAEEPGITQQFVAEDVLPEVTDVCRLIVSISTESARKLATHCQELRNSITAQTEAQTPSELPII